MPFHATYFDGRTAKRHEVTVAVGQRGLRIRQADGQESTWPWTDLGMATETFAGDPLRFERMGPDGIEEALVFDDAAVLKAIARANPVAAKAFAPPAGKRAYLARAAGAALAATIFASLLFTYGAPAVGAIAAAAVPVSYERELGLSVVDAIVPAKSRCPDATKLAALQAITDRLAAARPGSRYRYKLALSTDKTVNAFAAPGGFIIVNAGLLAKTKRPEALAGVLAHEIQHVEQRHVTKGIFRDMTLSTILRVVTGNAFGAVGSAATTLGELSYSRGDEEEADREGMRLMLAAGVDPQGMVEAFQMLEAEGRDLTGMLAYLSSHPRSADRVAKLKRLARAPGKPLRPLRLATPWAKVIASCK